MKIKIAAMVIICTYALCGCMYNDVVSDYNSRKNEESISEITDEITVTEISVTEPEKADLHNTGDTSALDDYQGVRYDQLNDDEKAAYTQLCEGIDNHDSCVVLDVPLKFNSLRKAYDAVISTLESQMYNPIRDTCSLGSQDKQMVYNVMLEYNFSEEEMERVKSEIEREKLSILMLLTDDMTQTQKEKVIHDELAGRCRYDTDAIAGSQEEFNKIATTTHCADAYGAIVEGKAVCEGYARAFRYLCNSAGIRCELVCGSGSSSMGHMWNIVYVDGEWHQVDVTYDDPVYSIEGKESIEDTYFNLSDEEMFKDHTVEEEFFTFPECT